jgi:D-inositol-3-phosphate glycosyltransferase
MAAQRPNESESWPKFPMNDQITTSTARENSQRSLIMSVPTGRAGARGKTHAPPIRAAVALLTGGGDKPYAIGMASALSAHGILIDFIGSDDLDVPELRRLKSLNFLNLRGDQRTNVSFLKKMTRVLAYYLRLAKYAANSRAKIFHILWNNKFELFDRTLLLFYYKLLGKRLVFTAHNVNARKRDSNDQCLNRLTLWVQYHLVDRIFVHTEQMRQELVTQFGTSSNKVVVIPFGINSTAPNTALTPREAKLKLGLRDQQRVLLFFGNIAPYKGLEYLIEAIALLSKTVRDYRLIIAGRPKSCLTYWEAVQRRISSEGLETSVIQRIEYVPDADTEVYFKAADVVVLPYICIFQSGVLLLAYNFGLPVIASNVGSLREDVVEGKTGFVCKPRDPADLAHSIETYFSSPLYRQLEMFRKDIQTFANEKYSWTRVGEITRAVYTPLLGRRLSSPGAEFA